MDKVKVRITTHREFFDEVAQEAARLDRSPSWVLGRCLDATLPKLTASVVSAAPSLRTQAQKAKPEYGKARAPVTRSHTEKSGSPERAYPRDVFVSKGLVFDWARLAARLGISTDDVLLWAWHASRESIRAMPSS